jgi:CPA2 family monovalent cation:H+ antiporter-2
MEVTILKDIVIIFALSTLVNLVFTRTKVPNVVGYLLTGIIAGPHLLSLVKSRDEIELMAEIGVILLLFTIGLEFSLKHLLKIRRLVLLGGLIQVSLTVCVFYLSSYLFGMDWQSSLFIGFLAALSSSALVLKLLQERSELTSNYGRTVLGILIFQDLLLVPLILFTNLLGEHQVNLTGEILLLALKAVLIIGLVYIGNRWLLPRILRLIAMTKNQELFMMSIFLICLAIALLTAELGMTLAFGAFLAGLMISESEYSHNVFGNIIPFKDTFTSFFFVSIGMLLDLSFVADNLQLVLISVFLVIVIKFIIASGTGFLLGHTFRGTILVGVALSQVGEFSFILAEIGFAYSILNDFYYQLFLAVAVITMALTPFLMKLSLPLANTLLKLPLPEFLKGGIFPLREIDIPDMKDHLVIIGTDDSALILSEIVKDSDMKHVSIVFNPALAQKKMKKGDMVVYGDAANLPILLKAHVDTARYIVISVGDIIPAMAIIEKVRQLNTNAFIMMRAKQIDNVEELYKLGADQVLPEKLEIAIDLFNRILIKSAYPKSKVTRILKNIRNMILGAFNERDITNQTTIYDEFSKIGINPITIRSNSKADGKSLIELQLRNKTGVTLVAIKRGSEFIEHPVPNEILESGDIVYVIGNQEQIESAQILFSENSNS